MAFRIFALIMILGLGFSSSEDKIFNFSKLTNLKHLTPDDYEQFINSTTIRPIFLLTNVKNDKLNRFYKEYDKSAKVLKAFNMDIGLLNCAHFMKKPAFCQTETIQKDIHVFRFSKILLKLSLETMFDVDSIVSNLLQILYLNEIPIIQSETERVEFEKNNLGKRNIVFCQIRAMGTYEHRVFLEVAHEFMKDYEFVVSTTVDGPSGLSHYETPAKISRAELWFLDCNRPDNEGPGCLSIKYRNAFHTKTVKTFLTLVTNPVKFDIPKDGSKSIYDGNLFNIAYFIYDSASRKAVSEQVTRLSKLYHGTINMVTVDSAHIDKLSFDVNNVEAPTFIIKLVDKKPFIMIHRFTQENIDSFLEKQLRMLNKEAGQEREKRDNITVVGENEFDDDVLTPDDLVAESTRTMKTLPNTTLIRALTDETFSKMVKSSRSILVLFYMRYDPVSMTFLRSYAEASQMFKIDKNRPLTMVECFDWTDVCQKENVFQYPTIRVYHGDSKFFHYDGHFHGSSVLNYFLLHSVGNPLILKAQEQVNEFLTGQYPKEAQDVAEIMGLAAVRSNSAEAAIFTELAEDVHGKYLLSITSDKLADSVCEQYSVEAPCIIFSNKRDLVKQEHVYKAPFVRKQILDFITKIRAATYIELTELNFPIYYQRKQPLAILFVDPSKHMKENDIVKSIASSDAFPNVLFTYMDMTSVNSLGTSVLAMYTSELYLPAMVLVDLPKAEVYLVKRHASFTHDTLRQWLRDIEDRKVKPDHILPEREWKPLKAPYDFTKPLPKEVLEGEDKLILNEHGLGFDAEGKPLADDKENDEAMTLTPHKVDQPSMSIESGAVKPMREEL